MKKIINTALVGFGLSGKAFHAPFLHVNDGFALRKVVERHGHESNEIYPEVTVVKDVHAVLSDKNIELVVIATPNEYHFDMVKACLAGGKNVICEKPFTNKYADALELIKLAREKGVHLFVYQNRRWDGDFLTIKKIFKSGVLGDIQYYEAHFDRYSPVRKRAAWRDEDQPGSGILFDLGPHLIDQALCLFGDPLTVSARLESQREGSIVDDFFEVRMKYKSHTAVLTAGMLVDEPGPRYIIHGVRGSFIKYGIDPQEEALRKGKLPEGENWGEDSPDKWGLVTIDYDDLNFDGRIETEKGNYMAFYDNVYDVIRENADQAVKPDEAARVIGVIEMAFRSNKLEGGKIAWEDMMVND